jgi:integration host factor subunit beta
MTKANLVDEIARAAEMSRRDSEAVVETVFDCVVKSLHAKDKIEIRGFGSFRTRERKGRIGRNPKTGIKVEVPPKTIPYFKPSRELKDLVNGSAAAPAAPAASQEPTAAPDAG